MSFFAPTPTLQALGDRLVTLTQQQFPALQPEQLALTWLVYTTDDRLSTQPQPQPLPLPQPQGYQYRGDVPIYPASVVKLFYWIALDAALKRGELQVEGDDRSELERALADMIVDSSNDATGYVLDVLTATTSGPPLGEPEWSQWQYRRNGVNRYLEGWQWPEWAGCNANQKTWGDGPYGRERLFVGRDLSNRNYLTTGVTARLMQGIVGGDLPGGAGLDYGGLLGVMARSLDPEALAADPENQVTGFLGGGLPLGTGVWSKAGLTSRVRHDAAYVEGVDRKPFILVAFTEGIEHSQNEEILPFIAAQALDLVGTLV